MMKFPGDIYYCNDRYFDIECEKLMFEILKISSPDLYIGIETGGGVIVRRSLELGLIKCSVSYLRASRSKVATEGKGWRSFIVPYIPTVFANIMRKIESLCREFIYVVKKTTAHRHLQVSSDCLLAINGSKVICIIDDAIDTGSSMLHVSELVSKQNRDAVVITAVITQTFSDPLVVPNVALYHNVLIRFPWSHDAK